MSSELIIKNKFDGNDYRISIAPVCKKVSVPNPLEQTFSGIGSKLELPRFNFDNIILEAAIFSKKKTFKPLFVIALDDGYSEPMTEEAFAKIVHHIIANEKIDDLKNGENDIYKKHGFIATEHDMWQLFLLSKMRLVFIFKDPRKN